MSGWFDTLAAAPSNDLARPFERGSPPDVERLPDYEYRSVNVGALATRLRLQKFIKGFFRDGNEGSIVEGYNVRVEQNPLDVPWQPTPAVDPPRRFGFFTVEPIDPAAGARAGAPPGALLLDYGASTRNPRWRIERLLRDYLVVPDSAQPDVLLGRAYLALGPRRLHAAYFVIERDRPAR